MRRKVDRVSSRRNLTNTFFLTLNTAVVGVLAAVSGTAWRNSSAWVLVAGLVILLHPVPGLVLDGALVPAAQRRQVRGDWCLRGVDEKGDLKNFKFVVPVVWTGRISPAVSRDSPSW
ncbi:hypothetical protein [Streptomyces sp. NPDC058964]|uniref:RipA family octameric membrane protein n=1 Tax=Streptomyces sp. NPDC058964 TaxID=3346681 RepID=UPI00367577E1